MTEPALTAFDLEALMCDVWNEVGDAGATTMVISHRTKLVLRRAMRMFERRKRVRRLIPRGSLVKMREIELPEIPSESWELPTHGGLRAFVGGG